MRLKLAVLFSVAAGLIATTVAASPAATMTARLVRVTSPVSRGNNATLVARVVPSRTCSIIVTYSSGLSHAKGLYPKRPTNGRVSWTWKVGTRTKPGRWPIRVACGTAGSFRTSFVVTY